MQSLITDSRIALKQNRWLRSLMGPGKREKRSDYDAVAAPPPPAKPAEPFLHSSTEKIYMIGNNVPFACRKRRSECILVLILPRNDLYGPRKWSGILVGIAARSTDICVASNQPSEQAAVTS